MPEAAEKFQEEKGISISITGGNTDPGLSALLAGDVDIAGSGRFLTDIEKTAGLAETLIGWDVMVVAVHPSNPVASLTRGQLRGIFSGTINNWKQLGGADQPVMVVTGPPGSGMREFVAKEILQGDAFTRREIISAIVDDADHQVSMLPLAICILSRSMIDTPGVKILDVEDIFPTERAISTRRYPLVKPLLLVTRPPRSLEADEFVEFALSAAGQEVVSRNFFRLKDRYSR